MLRKTIAYTDWDGNEREEDFYFNLTRTELTRMEMEAEGGLENMIIQLSQNADGKRIMDILEDVITRSYGIKEPKGRRFIKSPELIEEFKQTPAYDVLFTELTTNAGAAAEFINAIIPDASGKTVIPVDNTEERVAKILEKNPIVAASRKEG